METNILNIVFCECGTAFSHDEMKAFLVDTKIADDPNMMEVIINKLEKDHKMKELQLLHNAMGMTKPNYCICRNNV